MTVSVTDGDDTVSIPVTIDITDHPTPESTARPRGADGAGHGHGRVSR